MNETYCKELHNYQVDTKCIVNRYVCIYAYRKTTLVQRDVSAGADAASNVLWMRQCDDIGPAIGVSSDIGRIWPTVDAIVGMRAFIRDVTVKEMRQSAQLPIPSAADLEPP